MAIRAEREHINEPDESYWFSQTAPPPGGPWEFGSRDGIDGIYGEIDFSNSEPFTLFPPDYSKEHNNIVLIGGVTSSGKNYVGDRAGEVAGIKSVSSSSAIIRASGVPQDEIRFMNVWEYLPKKETAADEFLRGEPLFINEHFMAKHYLTSDPSQNPRETGIPGYLITLDFENKLKAMHYVVVIGDPREILLRRKIRNKQEGRTSDLEDEQIIALHQRLTIVHTERFAREKGAGFSIIYNIEDPDITDRNIAFVANLAKDFKK